MLPYVMKPARYLGLEQGAFRKPFQRASVTMVAAFPDLYEIGFSNYGLKMLYSLVNQHDRYMCDRVYAPAMDFKQKMDEASLPLFAVESFIPVASFDVLALSLQYELNYTTIFGLLECAKIPFRSADRPIGPTSSTAANAGAPAYPLIIAGGPGSANPMPLSPFIDVFIIGDGEHVLMEILDVIEHAKRDRVDKPVLLKRLATLEGLFIPGLTERAYKRIVDIAENPVEVAPLIPLVGAVHDRITVEARRGCDRMCRFCQPCFINLPVREQSIENIKKSALREVEKTGYDECSLLSLSIADYSYFQPLILEVAAALEKENVSLALPSQRADRFSLEVAEAVQTIRKSALTFAPEAGTQRLREVINKNLTDKEIVKAVTTSYRAGWNKVKLYFMIGLPTETHDDLDGIIDTVKRLQHACVEIRREPELSKRSRIEINVTLSNFVPKPHTPFQWFPMDTMAQLANKILYLREQFRGMKGVKLNFTDPEISKLEAVISKGGAELGDVIESAYRKGAYLDAWDESQNFAHWFQALEEHGIHHEAYTRDRACDLDGPLPWDVIDVGLTKEWLQTEYRKAMAATSTTPCFETCSVCGVCGAYSTWPKFIETPVAKALKQPEPGLPEEIVPVPVLNRKPVMRIRLTIEKRNNLRFISHLDWLRMIYRAVSRSKLPVAFTQGYNPRAKIGFGPALPLFTASEGEYLDLDMSEPVGDVRALLNPYLPAEGQILSVETIPLATPSIDSQIVSTTYRAHYVEDTTCAEPENKGNMAERIAVLRALTTLPVEVEVKKRTRRKNIGLQTKVLDLAPFLADLAVDEPSKTVSFTLRRRPAADRFPTGNPDSDAFCQVETGFDEQDNPTIIPDSENHSEFSELGSASVKPAWVLDLISPNTKWSLTRTRIELVNGLETSAVAPGWMPGIQKESVLTS